MHPFAVARSKSPAGYEVENSVRLNDNDSAYMSKTFGTPTNVDQWTFAIWFKVGNLGIDKDLFGCNSSSGNDAISIRSDNTIRWRVENTSGGTVGVLQTTQVIRDPSSWYHLICVYDSANATAGDRMKMYINGTEVTAFGTDTNPTQNTDSLINSAVTHYLGSHSSPGNFWDGYMSQTAFCDGQAYSATDFGEFDDQSEWRPIDVTGLTFGTNGFLQTYSKSDHFGYNAAISNSFDVSGVTGVSNELTRGADLTGAADGEEMTFSCWFRVTAGDAATQVFLYSNGAVVNMQRATNNKLWVGVSGTPGFGFYSDSTYVAGSGWHHMIVSAKTTSGDTAIHLYVDGADDGSTGSITGTGNMDLTHSDWGVMGTDVAGSNLQGDMAEAWYAQEYIDVSSAPNLARFITTGGLPVDLGSDGSTPTGTAPLLYHHLNEDEATSGFVSNAGTGGTMTLGGSTLVESAIEPRYNVDFTDSGLASDQVSCSPTNVFCTFSPIDMGSATVLADGNLNVDTTSSNYSAISTWAVSSGKWYYELTITTKEGHLGFIDVPSGRNHVSDTNNVYNAGWSINTGNSGTIYDHTSETAYIGNTISAGDTICFALDMDNGKFWARQNGDAWPNSGDPAAGTNAGDTNLLSSGTGTVSPAVDLGVGVVDANFGVSPDGAGGNADDNGYGDFDHAPPSGFLSLCTANLSSLDFDPADHHQVELVNHDGSSTAFTLGWDTDDYHTLYIIKNRDNTEGWRIVDTLSGITKYTAWDTPAAQVTDSTIITQSGTTVTLGAGLLADNYVVECHKAGLISAVSTSNSGTISDTNFSRSTNATTEFSIINYDGNNTTAATFDVGLSVAPSFYTINDLTTNNGFMAYHVGAGHGNSDYLSIWDTGVKGWFGAVDWTANTAPTATTITLGAMTRVNPSSNACVCYAWGAVDGYSAFGSYSGNGNALGPVINAGVSPSSTLLKKIAGTANDWTYIHEARDTYNASANGLRPDLTNAEQGSASGQDTDQLSTGMKIRNANNQMNTSGTDNYIYSMWGTPTLNKSGTPSKAR